MAGDQRVAIDRGRYGFPRDQAIAALNAAFGNADRAVEYLFNGIPDDLPEAAQAMDNLLAYLNDNCVPSAYWAGGPGWGTYKLAIEPRNGKDRPQMELMRKHLANDCTAIGPTPAQIAD